MMGADREGTLERSLIRGLPQPILAPKSVDPGELALIVGNDRIAECDSLSGNQQIVAANRCAGPFEPGADRAIGDIGRCGEGKHIEHAEHCLELAYEPLRSL